jgi:Secretion system C-terminal sorting domain
MTKWPTFFAAFFLLFSQIISAQTVVGGGIFSHTTWLKSKSPYIVTSNLVVFDNIILTIQPGVMVKFEDNTGLELRNGKLIAKGTLTDSIIFTSNNASPTKGIWKGIDVIGTTDPLGQGEQIKMTYCKGLYADLFLNLDYAYHTPYTFDNCDFGYNKRAFYDGLGVNGGVIIQNSLFYKNDMGIDNGLSYTVRKTTFRDNKIGAHAVAIVDSCIFMDNTQYALLPYGITTNNIFLRNKIASAQGYFNNGNRKFTGNVIKDNEIGVQILTYFNGSIDFSGNIICNNRLYNIERRNIINGETGNNNTADLSHNCWCTYDTSAIESKILDAKDDITLGLITTTPFFYACGSSLLSATESKENSSKIVLFPNPTTSEITVFCENWTPQYFTLLDMTGKQLMVKKTSTYTTVLDLSAYPSGVYLLKIMGTEGFVVKRIVKQ